MSRPRHIQLALAVIVLTVVSPVVAAQALAPAPSQTAASSATPTPAAVVAVSELLGQVRDALGLAEALAKHPADKGTPPVTAQLDSVTLELQAAASGTQGVKFTLFIFQFGSETTTKSTSTITLTLARPEKAKIEKGAAPRPFVEGLANLIVAAWQAVDAGRDQIKDLQPTKVSCAISFGVTKEGSGDLKLAMVPVGVEAGRTASRQSVQTITVTFKTEPPSSSASHK